jgi:hypothetical protein
MKVKYIRYIKQPFTRVNDNYKPHCPIDLTDKAGQ